ncbi:MAG: hypothetical protein ACI4SL_01870, partial [Candidatus Ornithospirochaeta sp.]
MKKAFLILLLLVFSSLSIFALDPPIITRVERDSKDEEKMYVYFDFETGDGGGEKAVVKLYDEEMKLLDSKTVGKSKKLEKKAFFKPSSSGRYFIEVIGIKGEEEIKSTLYDMEWKYPLFAPEISAINEGYNNIRIE